MLGPGAQPGPRKNLKLTDFIFSLNLTIKFLNSLGSRGGLLHIRAPKKIDHSHVLAYHMRLQKPSLEFRLWRKSSPPPTPPNMQQMAVIRHSAIAN